MPIPILHRSLAYLLLLYSAALVPSLALSLWYVDGQFTLFALIALCSALLGLALRLLPLGTVRPLRTRDGFAIVGMVWLFVSLIGSLPFIFGLEMSPSAAFFETTSAFTTTGATVIVGLDTLPQSILFYRQELQWLGGIGIVITAVALLPMLGVGGMQLFKAETAGPMKDDKLTPRMAQTARNLWVIYSAMTLACALLYWIGGMTPFDAIAHSLTTVSTGGFSTHDASMAYFDSRLLEGIAIVFMLLGSISFNVHFLSWKRGSLLNYWRNPETRAFLLYATVVAIMITFILMLTGHRTEPLEAVRYAVFETVAVVTSTGYGIDDFSLWPSVLPMLLIFSSFVGGCAGSTAGGMKVIRYQILIRQAQKQIRELVHPHATQVLKVGERVISSRVAESISAFFVAYVAIFAVVMMLLMAAGFDLVTAFGAVASCMNNLGPALGDVATNFTVAGPFTHWLLGITMLLGRLEIFTILVLFSPAFWRN